VPLQGAGPGVAHRNEGDAAARELQLRLPSHRVLLLPPARVRTPLEQRRTWGTIPPKRKRKKGKEKKNQAQAQAQPQPETATATGFILVPFSFFCFFLPHSGLRPPSSTAHHCTGRDAQRLAC